MKASLDWSLQWWSPFSTVAWQHLLWFFFFLTVEIFTGQHGHMLVSILAAHQEWPGFELIICPEPFCVCPGSLQVSLATQTRNENVAFPWKCLSTETNMFQKEQLLLYIYTHSYLTYHACLLGFLGRKCTWREPMKGSYSQPVDSTQEPSCWRLTHSRISLFEHMSL